MRKILAVLVVAAFACGCEPSKEDLACRKCWHDSYADGGVCVRIAAAPTLGKSVSFTFIPMVLGQCNQNGATK